MLTPQQIHTLSELLERQLLLFAASTLGPQILSDNDKSILIENGIDPERSYSAENDLVTNNFILGMLSNLLGEQKTKGLQYEELIRYINSGQHIPLNSKEKATIASLKMQSLTDIKSANGKIFGDINQVVGKELSTARANQEEFIREKVIEGISKRQSFKTIASELGRLTGDWTRNFQKSVQYISHTALNEGRAAILERRHDGDNEKAKMYFQVQLDACNKCTEKYLLNRDTREPRIFTLKQLQANGTNIGRKQNEWEATLSALHVNCRCLATEYVEGQIWNGHRFVWPEDKPKPKIERPKVRIIFNGKEYYV